MIKVQQKRDQARLLFRKGKYLQASKQLKQGLVLVPFREKEERILMLYDIGKAYEASRSLDSAKYFYDKAELYYNDSLSNFLKSYRYETKASVHHGTLQIDSTTYYALKSLDHARLSKKERRIFVCHMNLGEIFLSQNLLEKSLFYFENAQKMAQEMKDSISINAAITFKGQVEIERKNYDQAEQYLHQALTFFEQKQDPLGILLSKGHLSKLYLSKGELDKSVKIGFELLPLINSFEFRNDAKQMVSKANDMASLLGKDSMDVFNVNKAEQLSKDNMRATQFPKAKIEVGKALTSYYKNNRLASDFNEKDSDKVILGTELEKIIKSLDSLYKNSMDAKYTELETKYLTQQKEKENLQLKQQYTEQELALEKENKRKWLLAIGLLTALLTLSVFYFFFNRNRKQKRIIEKLQRELHHRIKNNLAIIDTFIDTTKDEIKDKEGIQKLSELQNRIESIYKVHELLYMAEGNITEVSAKTYIDTLVSGVQDTFCEKPVTILIDIASELTFGVEQSFPVGLIVNEFLTNSYKHAFNGRNDGKVNISMSLEKRVYHIKLSDNGIGLPKDFNIHTLDSFGMDIMKLLTEQLGGSFDLEGTEGVELNIKFESLSET